MAKGGRGGSGRGGAGAKHGEGYKSRDQRNRESGGSSRHDGSGAKELPSAVEPSEAGGEVKK